MAGLLDAVRFVYIECVLHPTYYRGSPMPSDLIEIQQLSPEKRYDYLVKHVLETQKVWILTDEHGCVMLNTEDEDCVPVWPSEGFAKDWATGDWQECKPLAIELKTWLQRWTEGLAGDEVDIVVFPNPGEDGLVISPDEFDQALQQKTKH